MSPSPLVLRHWWGEGGYRGILDVSADRFFRPSFTHRQTYPCCWAPLSYLILSLSHQLIANTTTDMCVCVCVCVCWTALKNQQWSTIYSQDVFGHWGRTLPYPPLQAIFFVCVDFARQLSKTKVDSDTRARSNSALLNVARYKKI